MVKIKFSLLFFHSQSTIYEEYLRIFCSSTCHLVQCRRYNHDRVFCHCQKLVQNSVVQFLTQLLHHFFQIISGFCSLFWSEYSANTMLRIIMHYLTGNDMPNNSENNEHQKNCDMINALVIPDNCTLQEIPYTFLMLTCCGQSLVPFDVVVHICE